MEQNNMEQLSLEQFDPTAAELHKMVEATQSITVDDLSDTNQLKLVHSNRITLKNARVAISKKGKELREEAIVFQKAVISKEKELISIIEPEEQRLQSLEDAANKIEETKKRQVLLPSRKATLESIGDAIECPDDEILNMNDSEFDAYRNRRVAAKNEADRLTLDAERRAIEEEKNRVAREQEIREAEERARQQERERLEQAEKERKGREERERVEAEKKARLAREAEERRINEENARLEKEKKYIVFKTKNGWTEETKSDFKEERMGSEIVLWRKLGTFKMIQNNGTN